MNNISNSKWYSLVSFLGSICGIAGLALTIYIWKFPIQNIQQEIKDAKYDFTKVFNEQSLDTKHMNGGEIVKQYYFFLNSEEYEKACSLRSTQECTMYDVNKFTQWVDDKKRYFTIKLNDGEIVKNIWNSNEKLENTNTEIWCARLVYRMNNEAVDISQVNQYSIAIRPDQKKEIRRILCEGEIKRGVSTSNCTNVKNKICINTET